MVTESTLGRTMTVPLCVGVTLGSSYRNLPTFVKVKENVWPGASTGEANGAWVETTRRFPVVAFLHTTVSLSAIVIVLGTKPVAVMATCTVAAVEPGTTATAVATMMSSTILFMSGKRRGRGIRCAILAPMRVLVTGGTGRVGSAIAERLREEGHSVLAAGRADGDLRDAAAARQLVEGAAGELGGLDLVVHAAGEGFVPKPVAELTEADWDAAFGATAKGAFFVAQAATPHLRDSHGVIVMIEDVAGYRPWPSFAAHCAAKAAQSMLTRVLARALAPEVRVCGIAPGPVAVAPDQASRRAAETALGRIGAPEDVAEAVLFLAGASFVTGATLAVDGGSLLQTGRSSLA